MKYKINITPLGMLNNARVWREIYYQNIERELDRQVVGIYCLLTSVEMYLKAYLIFHNPTYAQTSKLKDLGHDLNKICTILKETKACRKIADLLEKAIKKYKLDEHKDITTLRYPESGSMFFFHRDYKTTEHDFNQIIDAIEGEINIFFTKKWKEKHQIEDQKKK